MGTAQRWWRRGLTAAAAISVGLLALGAPAQAEDDAQVYVVHGIPDQPVDVYVDSELTLEGFQPGEVAGPLALPAGTYSIALTAPGDGPENAIVAADVDVPGGENVSLVAHLTEGGDPTLTAFVNDVSEVPAGEARLTVRHTAAAPAVDVRADGEALVTDLTNPNEATAQVPAGTVSAEVLLAGTDEVVIGPADLELTEGALTVVYAIGSADAGTLSLVVQVIEHDGMPGTPSGVPGGSAGLAATGLPMWWFGLLAAGALMVAGGALWYRRSAGVTASQ
ncbi:DUF4397 domain-containing protein [Natronosporangium hydrolyticum]|uniref:DUF4397 domain-containing protein n=1 Tax=Natronosporangium hydrolyticum TaxID=2811111 RepID=A0A895YHN0_9ACTN|nr:DUF4397 domain-containing protein [Natronosporangium hydrolyticum]QSB13660.1 DUF4397 domain-containing protein [Natronosporangium hydrolyticum]